MMALLIYAGVAFYRILEAAIRIIALKIAKE
jgi:hypothetical protein